MIFVNLSVGSLALASPASPSFVGGVGSLDRSGVSYFFGQNSKLDGAIRHVVLKTDRVNIKGDWKSYLELF